MYFGSCSLASYRFDRRENPLLTDLKAEGCRLCASLPHCDCLQGKCQNCFSSLFNALADLFVGIGARLGLTQEASNLVGQVEGGDLLGLRDLLLVGLHLEFNNVQ